MSIFIVTDCNFEKWEVEAEFIEFTENGDAIFLDNDENFLLSISKGLWKNICKIGSKYRKIEFRE